MHVCSENCRGVPKLSLESRGYPNKDMYVTNDTTLQEQRAGSLIPICTTSSGILSYGPIDLV